jgi:hypothetical protein
MLSREGRAVLEGRHRALSGILATGQTRFVGATGLLERQEVRRRWGLRSTFLDRWAS